MSILTSHPLSTPRQLLACSSWSTFIKAHWGAIAATDLFTVEVVNPFGLVRYHVLFVIDIATRCVCIGKNAPKSLSRHDGASVIRACRQRCEELVAENLGGSVLCDSALRIRLLLSAGVAH